MVDKLAEALAQARSPLAWSWMFEVLGPAAPCQSSSKSPQEPWSLSAMLNSGRDIIPGAGIPQAQLPTAPGPSESSSTTQSDGQQRSSTDASKARASNDASNMQGDRWGVARSALKSGAMATLKRRQMSVLGHTGGAGGEEPDEPVLSEAQRIARFSRKSINQGFAKLGDAADLATRASRKSEMAGKSASLHAGPSGDVVAINNFRSRLGQLLPQIIRMPAWFVLLIGFILYLSVIVIFALLYHACSEDCYSFAHGVEYSLAEMVWLSVHTFSSVGFGSIYPVCSSSQLLVMFESYAAIVVQSVIGAYVVFIVMRSRARIRFSKHVLVTHNDNSTSFVSKPANGKSSAMKADGYFEINFRLVRESYTPVRLGLMPVLTLCICSRLVSFAPFGSVGPRLFGCCPPPRHSPISPPVPASSLYPLDMRASSGWLAHRSTLARHACGRPFRPLRPMRAVHPISSLIFARCMPPRCPPGGLISWSTCPAGTRRAHLSASALLDAS